MSISARPNTGVDSPRAWIVVLAAFIGAFVSFGVSYCFGVFLKPIATEFHASHAAMSALFSTITVLSFFLAPFTGELADRLGPRPVVAAGAVLMFAALLATAHVHYFPLMYLTYGVGVGAAVACIYIPGIAAVGEWFKVRRDIALGLAISGIGCGTLVAAPLSAVISVRYGWRTAFEIFGWISGGLLVLCAALMAKPPIPKESGKSNCIAKVRTRAFALLYLSMLLSGIAVYISFVYLPAFAADIGISRVAAAALIGYIGASSVVGRLGLNAFAPRFGLITMYQVSFILMLVSFVVWVSAHTYGTLVAFALVMGVGYGGIAAMSPAVAAFVFGVEGLGELLGVLLTSFGSACLIGPTLAGILVDETGDYKWPVFIGTAASVASLVAVLPLRAYRVQKPSLSAAAAAD